MCFTASQTEKYIQYDDGIDRAFASHENRIIIIKENTENSFYKQ